MKQIKWNGLKTWDASLREMDPDWSHKLGNIDPLAVLSKMTALEMQTVLSMVAAANRLGWKQSRETRLSNQRFKDDSMGGKNSVERRRNFGVIQGGAA